MFFGNLATYQTDKSPKLLRTGALLESLPPDFGDRTSQKEDSFEFQVLVRKKYQKMYWLWNPNFHRPDSKAGPHKPSSAILSTIDQYFFRTPLRASNDTECWILRGFVENLRLFCSNVSKESSKHKLNICNFDNYIPNWSFQNVIHKKIAVDYAFI